MTTEQQIDILTKARAFIAQGWAQHNSARDADGHPTNPHCPAAVRFCVYGALDRTGKTTLDSEKSKSFLLPRFLRFCSLFPSSTVKHVDAHKLTQART